MCFSQCIKVQFEFILKYAPYMYYAYLLINFCRKYAIGRYALDGNSYVNVCAWCGAMCVKLDSVHVIARCLTAPLRIGEKNNFCTSVKKHKTHQNKMCQTHTSYIKTTTL